MKHKIKVKVNKRKSVETGDTVPVNVVAMVQYEDESGNKFRTTDADTYTTKVKERAVLIVPTKAQASDSKLCLLHFYSSRYCTRNNRIELIMLKVPI